MRTPEQEYGGDFRQATNSYTEDVIAYFDAKTEAILKRYGPGPRIHYHTGLMDDPPSPNESAEALRWRLVAAQERILCYAAKVWGAPSNLAGRCSTSAAALVAAPFIGLRNLVRTSPQ